MAVTERRRKEGVASGMITTEATVASPTGSPISQDGAAAAGGVTAGPSRGGTIRTEEEEAPAQHLSHDSTFFVLLGDALLLSSKKLRFLQIFR